jgi:hypothetical protein
MKLVNLIFTRSYVYAFFISCCTNFILLLLLYYTLLFCFLNVLDSSPMSGVLLFSVRCIFNSTIV